MLNSSIASTPVLYSTNLPQGQVSLVMADHRPMNVQARASNQTISVVLDNVSSIVKPDQILENGVLHGTDHVILPSGFTLTVAKVLIGMGSGNLINALQATNLLSHFTGVEGQNYTIFAPSDEALAQLQVATTGNEQKLERILMLHIVKGNVHEILEGMEYEPLLPEYILVGGKNGLSIIAQNLSDYRPKGKINNENNNNQNSTTEPPHKRSKRADSSTAAGALDSVWKAIASGTYYQATILGMKTASNGVVFKIDRVLGPDEPVSSARWIILAVIIILVIVAAIVAFFIYRRRKQAEQGHVRLLD